MKTFLVCLLAALSTQAAPLPVTWALTCDYPTNQPVLSYYAPGTNQAIQVLGTSTLGTPLANWQVVTTFTNWTLFTNGTSIILSNNVTVSFAQWFFYLNPTNVFGAAPLAQYGALLQTGPPWSTVSRSVLNKQGP